MRIQIWTEGYAATGEGGPASKVWEGEANDFDDAVNKYLDYEELNNWHDIRKYYTYRPDNERSKHAIWACALFDNEADARKSFG